MDSCKSRTPLGHRRAYAWPSRRHGPGGTHRAPLGQPSLELGATYNCSFSCKLCSLGAHSNLVATCWRSTMQATVLQQPAKTPPDRRRGLEKISSKRIARTEHDEGPKEGRMKSGRLVPFNKKSPHTFAFILLKQASHTVAGKRLEMSGSSVWAAWNRCSLSLSTNAGSPRDTVCPYFLLLLQPGRAQCLRCGSCDIFWVREKKTRPKRENTNRLPENAGPPLRRQT